MTETPVWELEGFSRETDYRVHTFPVRNLSTAEVRELLELDAEASLSADFPLSSGQAARLQSRVEGLLEPERYDYTLGLRLVDESYLESGYQYTDLWPVWLLRGFSRFDGDEIVHDFPLIGISDDELATLLDSDSFHRPTRDQISRLQHLIGGRADFDKCLYVLGQAIVDRSATGSGVAWYPAPIAPPGGFNPWGRAS